MARILYGVMGDAGGHVARSRAIAQQLKAHEIVFVGGGRVAQFKDAGYDVVDVPMLGTALQANRVRLLATAANAAAALASRAKTLARLTAVIRDFDPDLIVTDYEYFLPLAARRLGRSCISVDRQHALTLCRYEPPPGERIGRWLTLGIIRALYSAASHYIVCSFVPMQPVNGALTEVLPPVLRDSVVERASCAGDHAVVYVRGVSADWLRGLLSGRSRRYVIYGYDTEAEEGNLVFRRSSDEGFLADLSSCACVIANGGHNLISEALYYGKPVFCLPVGLFYEQLVNAHLLAQAGFGSHAAIGAEAQSSLASFERSLPDFERHIAAIGPWDRHAISARLDAMIAACPRPASG